jgi:hypothetical protein
LVGAFMDLAHVPYVVQEVRSIGYPTFTLYIVVRINSQASRESWSTRRLGKNVKVSASSVLT